MLNVLETVESGQLGTELKNWVILLFQWKA